MRMFTLNVILFSVIIIIKINQMNSKRLKKWYTRHYEAFKNDQRDP